MKRRKAIIKVMSVMIMATLLVGCKPTEKNYQSAYEAARNKKKADAAVDPDMALPATGLQSLDGPKGKEVNGETLRLQHIYVTIVGSSEGLALGKYNVAVAKYKMPTNAKAQTEKLREEGINAFPVESADGAFYVIAATCPTYEETADFVKGYKKTHPASTFVGLDGEPLIIER